MVIHAEVNVRELGIPVRSLNWVRLFPGQDRQGRPLLLASMGQNVGLLFVCQIDLHSGHCTQYPAVTPESDYPTATYQNPRTGVLYIGAAHCGHLYRFDPNLPPPQRKLEDLGPIDPEGCIFPCRIDEDPEGMIWIGGYGGCSLTRFDPRSGRFQRFGRMDEIDQYFYPFCGDDGTLAGVVRVCKVHVEIINPRTGEHRTVGPVIDTQTAGGSSGAKLELLKGGDGLLYLRSSQGCYRLGGMEAMPIEADAIPAAPPAALPDGSQVEFTDAAAQVFRQVRIHSPQGRSREITLDWQGQGTSLFLVHHGPDQRIYGSSVLPEHLFRCELDGSGMVDLGQCSVSAGEAYSMANLDGKLYIASYPAARLSIYDPAKPYRFGEDRDANPRDLGRVDEVAYRPRAMLAGPAGKVWIGSIPDYGMWGGTLTSYDPLSGRLVSHRHLIEDCSVVSLAWLAQPQRLLVGLSIEGGSGTTPRAAQAGFVLWDPLQDQIDRVERFDMERIAAVTDLCVAASGQVYAIVKHHKADAAGSSTARHELLLIDGHATAILDRSPFHGDQDWPQDVSLRVGPDQAVYGAGHASFYRIKPGTAQRQVLWTADPGGVRPVIDVAGPIVGRSFYFASNHRLCALEMPATD